MTLKVAIIGAGNMAREHIKAFAALPDVAVVGIHSRTIAKAQTLATDYAIPLVAASIAELYQVARPDLVVVAVNIVPAREILLECITHGVPLLTEKPIALDLQQSIEVRDAAHAAGVPVWVGLNRRFYGATRAALAALTDDIGPRVIQVFDQQDLDAVRRIGHPQAVADNWMYANSIHLVDYLLAFGRGAVTGVEVHHAYDPQAPTLVNASVRFASGDIGLYTALWNGPGPWACHIVTPSVRWEMQPLEGARWCPRGSRQWTEVPQSDADARYKPGFYAQALAVVEALLGSTDGLTVGIDEAVRTTELVASIYGLPKSAL